MSSIIFDNVSKAYHKGTSASTSLIEAIYRGSWGLINRLNGQNNSTSDLVFWALKDVSFEVKPGEAFAIVGPNGAGKSTVLKLLSRVSCPSRGNIITKGKMACLIELGAGFHPELTGRENIFLYGTIMGMTQSEIKNNFDEIVEFSGISEFLDTPLKRYSSGMHARLGFSVAIHTRPDILLVDEVLAVGDWAFQQKCYAEMKKYKDRGTTIIFVSHNMDAIKYICERGIVLNNGGILLTGGVFEIINSYYKAFEKSVSRDNDIVKIKNPRLVNESKDETQIFQSGEKAIFMFELEFSKQVSNVEIGVFVHHISFIRMMSTGSKELGIVPYSFKMESKVLIKCSFFVNLLKGDYFIGCEVRAHGFSNYLAMNLRAVDFSVHEGYSHGGYVHLQPNIFAENLNDYNK